MVCHPNNLSLVVSLYLHSGKTKLNKRTQAVQTSVLELKDLKINNIDCLCFYIDLTM